MHCATYGVVDEFGKIKAELIKPSGSLYGWLK